MRNSLKMITYLSSLVLLLFITFNVHCCYISFETSYVEIPDELLILKHPKSSINKPLSVFADDKIDRGLINMNNVSYLLIINKPGYYWLDANISNCNYDIGVLINSSDVVFDGNGHLLSGKAPTINYYGIYVNDAVNVTIRNLLIKDWEHGSILVTKSTNISIYNVSILSDTLSNNGIIVKGSSKVYIHDNLIFGSAHHDGITVKNSKDVKIFRNLLVNNFYGLKIRDSDNIEVFDNSIEYNKFGLEMLNVISSKIWGNDIKNVLIGSYIKNSKKIEITLNLIKNNGWAIIANFSFFLVVSSNLIFDAMYYGFLFLSSGNNIISGNRIVNVSRDGLHLYDSSSNIIHGNVFSNCGWSGILLWLSRKNFIFNNSIVGNNVGVEVYNSSSNYIFFNNFVKNLLDVNSFAGNFWFSRAVSYIFNGSFFFGKLGNFWEAFSGLDLDGDGVFDSPYFCDYRPLAFPTWNFSVLDFDGDGLDDFFEFVYGTNSLVFDSDWDGFGDGVEVSLGTDPLSPFSHPDKNAERIFAITYLIVTLSTTVSTMLTIRKNQQVRKKIRQVIDTIKPTKYHQH